MMNLSITGKKMTTPIPTKKVPEITSPIKAQNKVVTAKPIGLNKPKPILDQNSKGSQIKKVQVMKIQPKKITQKKQQKPKKQQIKAVIEQKKQQKKVETPIIVEVKKEQVIGKVTIRYNHYKQQFSTVNGILSFLPIEQKYSFSDVFKGNFLPLLKKFKQNDQIQPQSTGKAIDYTWKVEQGLHYKLQIREDEEQEMKVQKRTYKAPEKNNCPFKKNARFDELTQQMKKMDPSQLGSVKHRELLEQRDLQDVLFS